MANLHVNKIIIAGNLTADPELRATASGVHVTQFTVAVNRNTDRNEVDFVRVTAWRGKAEFICRYFRKGSSIFLIGRIQVSASKDKDGKEHTKTDIVAEEVSFVDSKKDSVAPQDDVGEDADDGYSIQMEEIEGDGLPF